MASFLAWVTFIISKGSLQPDEAVVEASEEVDGFEVDVEKHPTVEHLLELISNGISTSRGEVRFLALDPQFHKWFRINEEHLQQRLLEGKTYTLRIVPLERSEPLLPQRRYTDSQILKAWESKKRILTYDSLADAWSEIRGKLNLPPVSFDDFWAAEGAACKKACHSMRVRVCEKETPPYFQCYDDGMDILKKLLPICIPAYVSDKAQIYANKTGVNNEQVDCGYYGCSTHGSAFTSMETFKQLQLAWEYRGLLLKDLQANRLAKTRYHDRVLRGKVQLLDRAGRAREERNTPTLILPGGLLSNVVFMPMIVMVGTAAHNNWLFIGASWVVAKEELDGVQLELNDVQDQTVQKGLELDGVQDDDEPKIPTAILDVESQGFKEMVFTCWVTGIINSTKIY